MRNQRWSPIKDSGCYITFKLRQRQNIKEDNNREDKKLY